MREAFNAQADWCTRLGSPFTAKLLSVLGERLGTSTATGEKVLTWQGDPSAMADSVPLRLAGALHALAGLGSIPALTAVYPPGPLPSTAELGDIVLKAIQAADDSIFEWLNHAPQTNEVARSAVLFPGLQEIAARTSLPLELFEAGASAGLNLIPDRYSYSFGGEQRGASESTVLLSPAWTGAPPSPVAVRIQSRRGCDLNPIDLSDALQRERLLAYVWADQVERLSRVKAAIELARTDLPIVDTASANEWLPNMISPASGQGATRVLFHSIAFQYFPTAAQKQINEYMQHCGQYATAENPLAWLAFEQAQDNGPCLTLRLWPDGGKQLLATASDAHARQIDWLVPSSTTGRRRK